MSFPERCVRFFYQRRWLQFWAGWRSLVIVLGLCGCCFLAATPAWAGLDDDRFDGNIFALYGGNGSLVPPRVTLTDSFQKQKPALLVFYINDSSDCKQYSTVVSQLQAYYGRAADFIPVDVDALPLKVNYGADEPGRYYQGVVPQTVLLNQSGQVVLNAKGKVEFETVDDQFRDVFDLLPRSESVPLKRRLVNEFNTELVR